MSRNESFDVVVVGAGAAGCAVAARLSASHRVLLLEAGPDLRRRIPPELRDGWSLNRDYYWGTQSEPDEYVTARPVPRCKLVGGTSWMTRFAVRGSPADFDEWEAAGCPGWSFEEVLPYFVRIENDLDYSAEEFHGSSGSIPVTRYLGSDRTGVHETTARACEAIGLRPVEDHNKPGEVGVGRMPMSSVDGSRVSAADAYLPWGGTSNQLTIRADTMVSRVILDRDRACGVELVDGSIVTADWVVLSAGVFATPAILQRSGIGPADQLRMLEIPPISDLRGVGMGLGDHPATELDCGYAGSVRTTPVLHSIASWHSEQTPKHLSPDLLLWIADPDEEGFFITVLLLKPEARGSVRLRSADPHDPPEIRLPIPALDADLDRLFEGYALAMEVAREASSRGAFPEVTGQDRSKAAIREEIRRNRYSVPHFVGTCAMGAENDPKAVVDVDGRVHGIDSLSVIDASIMPIVPSGFTHLPTLAIAERLGEELATRI